MSTATTSVPVRSLTTSLQYLKGVGPIRAPLLERLGLHTIEHLIYDFPRSYQDLDDHRAIRDLQDGLLQTVRGTVVDLDVRELGPGRCVAGALVDDGTGLLRLIWF